MSVTVKTQAELNAALAAKADIIYIDSPAGVWLTVSATHGSRVEAWGSSRVVARGSSSVEAWGSSRVVARGSSSVVAWDSSSVEAWDSSRVVAWDSSRVVARGSSRVVARGSSSVVAWDSSRVEAWGSSSVEAWDSSSVVAGTHVAVHLHSQRVTLSGGVVIDMTALDLTDPQAWCDYAGIRVEDGNAILCKAVDDNWHAGHSYKLTAYAPGTTVTAPDWRDDNDCGGGLHVCPTPHHARDHFFEASRFVEVSAPLVSLRVIDLTKCKVPSLVVLREVDLWRDEVTR